MSIASEITRLQGVKSDILQAISDKGVTVPAGSDLAACPALIADISGGGAITLSLANIMPTTGIKVVDDNGYIGGDFLNPYYPGTNYYNNFAIKASGADFSSAGLGQVTFVDTSTTIGGRVYRTVTINGVTWMAENLDYKFSGVAIDPSSLVSIPAAYYYDGDEATYGIDGVRKSGLLYNGYSVKLLNDNKSSLCPGWHVATTTEWDALINYLGGFSAAGQMLKSLDGSAGNNWPTGWNGNDMYGFNILPSGIQYTNSLYIGTRAYYWAGDGITSSSGHEYNFSSSSTVDYRNDDLEYGFSVRLVKDSA